ncbi:MAG TPA: peroxide stress protein YaaA [Salinivirga sp.]|uniref:peroxide stress protein YaaA n=1 Tax=Salinivirga sp. TaxID=1970192 RepID=UPI002B48F558|nr:peroxide stress protein YaaA [Salinivirga sp.]HKK59127.1 peroxide stress protein YaaA [Salinivirga sp.]
MLFILSPAKTLDFEHEAPVKNSSQPLFKDEAAMLMEQLKKLSQDELSKLMNVSNKIAELNTIRHQNWQKSHTQKNAKQSIYAFRGEVYNGLNIEQFDEQDLEFAQGSLRILSGLYGILRPLDLIQPYRLEMGTKLTNTNGKNLYEFWSDQLAKTLNKQGKENGTDTLVNLASNEYYKAVKKDALKLNVITPVFKELKDDNYKVIAIYAKKARGLMSAYIIRNRITHAEDLKNFSEAGYMYAENLSSSKEMVFTRG